jgi:hypothetical protein
VKPDAEATGTEAPETEAPETEAEAATESEAPRSLLRRVLAHRRRIGTVAMVALILLLVTHGSTVLPSTLELAIPLSAPSTVTQLEVTLLDGEGEEAHRLTRRFDGDAPEAVELDASLLPGDYDVEVRVTREGSESLLHGSVEVPSDGRVRVRLRE